MLISRSSKSRTNTTFSQYAKKFHHVNCQCGDKWNLVFRPKVFLNDVQPTWIAWQCSETLLTCYYKDLTNKRCKLKHVIWCTSGLRFSCYVALRDWCPRLGDSDSSSSRVEMSVKKFISFSSCEILPLKLTSTGHLGTSGTVPITQWSRATSQQNADVYRKMFLCITFTLVHLRFSIENIV